MAKNTTQRSNQYVRAHVAVMDFLVTTAKVIALALFASFALAVLGTGFMIGLVYILMVIGMGLAVLALAGLAVLLFN